MEIKPMSPSYPTHPAPPTGRIEDLDDATIRRAHPVLDRHRVMRFASWIDQQLELLEHRFRSSTTPASLRTSLGR
jgi:hypothetical protein